MCAEERVRVALHCHRPGVSSVCAQEREGDRKYVGPKVHSIW